MGTESDCRLPMIRRFYARREYAEKIAGRRRGRVRVQPRSGQQVGKAAHRNTAGSAGHCWSLWWVMLRFGAGRTVCAKPSCTLKVWKRSNFKECLRQDRAGQAAYGGRSALFLLGRHAPRPLNERGRCSRRQERGAGNGSCERAESRSGGGVTPKRTQQAKEHRIVL